MRKREEFAVSLRKQNKQVKLNEKRAKIGTKARPEGQIWAENVNQVSELLSFHPELSDFTLPPVIISSNHSFRRSFSLKVCNFSQTIRVTNSNFSS